MIRQGNIALPLIPQVSVPLNTSDCLCESLEDLASVIQSPLGIEHDCHTNSDCDGMQCELDINSDRYFLDLVVFSCMEPPAIDVIVEDEEQERVFEQTFTESGTRNLTLGLFPMILNSTVIHHNYSVDVEVSTYYTFIIRISVLKYKVISLTSY